MRIEVIFFILTLLPTASLSQGMSGGGVNLIGNGSFESVNGDSISPWVWSGGLAIVVAEPQHVADGSNCAVVLNTIYQDVKAASGTWYQLRFAFGGDDEAQIGRGPLTVSWGSQLVSSIPYDPVSTQAPNWRYLTFGAFSTSDTERLSFSTLPNVPDALIDNVSLVAVPEPSVVTLFSLVVLVVFSKRWSLPNLLLQ